MEVNTVLAKIMQRTFRSPSITIQTHIKHTSDLFDRHSSVEFNAFSTIGIQFSSIIFYVIKLTVLIRTGDVWSLVLKIRIEESQLPVSNKTWMQNKM